MSNLLFLVNHQLSDESGISKKIISQFDALSSSFNHSFLCNFSDADGYYTRVINYSPFDKSVASDNKLQRFILEGDFSSVFQFCLNNNITHVYIRYTHFANYSFIKLIERLKRNNVKLVLEIPTYPYDNEYVRDFSFKGAYRSLKLRLERVFRRKMKDYVDRIVTFSDHEKIFGIETICISNAVSTELAPCCNNFSDIKNELRLVGVAVLAHWHGYDRLIKSLAAYNLGSSSDNKPTIIFDIVGDGEILCSLKSLTTELGVSDFVNFYGYLSGDALDSVITAGHIGVDSLGRHRSGNRENNSLKSKEYIMRGLPVLKSHVDRSIDDLDFVYTTSCDEEDIDLRKVVAFFHQVSYTPTAIRKVGRNKFSWNIQMKKVLTEANWDE